jgi:hypothetical protein
MDGSRRPHSQQTFTMKRVDDRFCEPSFSIAIFGVLVRYRSNSFRAVHYN